MIEKKIALPENIAEKVEELSDQLGISESELLRNSILGNDSIREKLVPGEINGQ